MKSLRILLITYYWPPSGGAGVQRWLKMVKYLAKAGHKITIYTPSNPAAPLEDSTLLRDVPPEVTVLQKRIVEPASVLRHFAKRGAGAYRVTDGKKSSPISRVVSWVRANLFIPDARCLWIRPSTRYLRKWLRNNACDAVITTGPPHSMHLIGRNVKRCTGTLWIADFRDPWTGIDYFHHLPLTAAARERHLALEQSVVKEADGVLVVSPAMRNRVNELHNRGTKVIYNGYDEADFANLPTYRATARFTLVYAGDMNADRNPNALWAAIQWLSQQEKIAPDNFQVRIYGTASPQVTDNVAKFGISAYVEQLPPVPHAQIALLLGSASALLLVVNQVPNAEGILTGKLFEYLASRRPILSIAPTNGDASKLITSLSAGECFGYDDWSGIAQCLSRWKAQDNNGMLQANSKGVERYSRRLQAELIATYVASLATNRPEKT